MKIVGMSLFDMSVEALVHLVGSSVPQSALRFCIAELQKRCRRTANARAWLETQGYLDRVFALDAEQLSADSDVSVDAALSAMLLALLCTLAPNAPQRAALVSVFASVVNSHTDARTREELGAYYRRLDLQRVQRTQLSDDARLARSVLRRLAHLLDAASFDERIQSRAYLVGAYMDDLRPMRAALPVSESCRASIRFVLCTAVEPSALTRLRLRWRRDRRRSALDSASDGRSEVLTDDLQMVYEFPHCSDAWFAEVMSESAVWRAAESGAGGGWLPIAVDSFLDDLAICIQHGYDTARPASKLRRLRAIHEAAMA